MNARVGQLIAGTHLLNECGCNNECMRVNVGVIVVGECCVDAWMNVWRI